MNTSELLRKLDQLDAGIRLAIHCGDKEVLSTLREDRREIEDKITALTASAHG